MLSRVYLKYRSYQDFNNHPDVLDHWTKVNGERLFGRPRSRIVQAWRELAAEGLPKVAGMPVPVTSWRFLLATLRQMQSTGAAPYR